MDAFGNAGLGVQENMYTNENHVIDTDTNLQEIKRGEVEILFMVIQLMIMEGFDMNDPMDICKRILME
ncbi:hypothetical protein DPMN_039988 [Dreissena polymorpha]|uniref:Uncharacterized protein n=1 Tax=Dreissena polymorpha TaxID=45954 RepID=A0A9D4CVU2_DREPO|nr:hypothetical protein DPMN_039988 [Dreissena polymorpha]